MTGRVYDLVSRRPFHQLDVLEPQNVAISISGKKNRLRVYNLPYLRAKIMKTEGVCLNTEYSCTHPVYELTYSRSFGL